MKEFNISKSCVLKEFYIRELPVVISWIKKKRQNETLDKLYDNLLNLRIAAATAGLGASPETIEELNMMLRDSIAKIAPNDIQTEQEEPKDPIEQLKRLQGVIAQNRKKRR